MYQRKTIVKQAQHMTYIVLCMAVSVLVLMGYFGVYSTVRGATSCSSANGSNCTIREWFDSLQGEAFALECTYTRMQKSIALLNATSCSPSIISKRVAQLEKLKRAIESLHEEMFHINATCTSYGGPDCTIPICDSKCLNCTSPGKCVKCSGHFIGSNCSSCDGNWDGTECASCKFGWSGSECITPVCDSKCTVCASPGNCSACSGNFIGSTCSSCVGNWDGANCSTCKYGWSGSDCLTPIVDLGELVNSTILNRTHAIRFVYEIMKPVQNNTIKRLYRASKDGFAVSKFHSLCDNKGANFLLVKADTGAIFGGFTSVGWLSNLTSIPGSATNLGYYGDTKAFLFSLISSTNEERFTKLIQNGPGYNGSSKDFVIHYQSFLGPDFGLGDLTITNNANTAYGSSTTNDQIFTNMGNATYLTGAPAKNRFLVTDMEVYTV